MIYTLRAIVGRLQEEKALDMFNVQDLAALLATLPLVFGAAAAGNEAGQKAEQSDGTSRHAMSEAEATPQSGRGNAAGEGGGGKVWGRRDWAAVRRLTGNICARMRCALLRLDQGAEGYDREEAKGVRNSTWEADDRGPGAESTSNKTIYSSAGEKSSETQYEKQRN